MKNKTKPEWEKKFDKHFGIDDDWDNRLFLMSPSQYYDASEQVKTFIRSLLSAEGKKVKDLDNE
jgi:hypothetical protein